MAQPTTRPHILLLGGCSGVGKTTAARAVAHCLGMPHILVDDIRIGIQAVVSPAQNPALHTFRGDFLNEMTPEEIVEGLITVGRAIAPALQVIVSHHLARANAGPILLEGDGILPQWVAQGDFRDVAGTQLTSEAGRVRCVFLVEPEEAALVESLLERASADGSAISAEEEAWQRRYAYSSWRYGQWLAAEAERFDLPVVAPRPFETLVDRLLAILQTG